MRSTDVTESRDVHDPSVKRADEHVELKDGFSVDLLAQNIADKGILCCHYDTYDWQRLIEQTQPVIVFGSTPCELLGDTPTHHVKKENLSM